MYKDISDGIYTLVNKSNEDTVEVIICNLNAFITKLILILQHPPMESLVSPMQMVRCYVLGNSTVQKDKAKKKHIMLSMRQSLIHKGLAFKHFIVGFAVQGYVASKEDHG